MKKLIWTLLAAVLMVGCTQKNDVYVAGSPDGEIEVNFWLENGKPMYAVSYHGTEVIKPSKMGFVLLDNDTLSKNFRVESIEENSVNESWEQPWGQVRTVENNYNEITLNMVESDGQMRGFAIEFRVFNDGVGFRYVFPEQPNLTDFVIMDELTGFNLAGDHTAWWIKAYQDNRYEYLYENTPVSEMDTVHTPLTMIAADGTHISIHEAALENYASMQLISGDNNSLKCDLAPWSDGKKVKTSAPTHTPWRTIQLADEAGDLITSTMILNLNEPNKLEDMSWVKPTKYLGIWWGMHIGKYTFWESETQGATTENAKKYIDFAAKVGIDHLLIEGWNKGWTPEWYMNKLHEFHFTNTADGFDFQEVIDYADEHGVNIIGYHETGSNIDNYLAQISDGMQMYHDAGMHSVKIGQVGSRMMLREWHYGQYGVNYYSQVLDSAADYELTVNFHEPIKPTGLHRTYPHWLTSEGARGQEYNAWSEGNPPEHTVIIPFTRLLGGPMDFTPGIFSIEPTRVHTTLAKQLALYLTIHSPLQKLADLPENYDGHPAFKFLQDVPVNWEETVVINAQISDYFTIARKDRFSDDWYLGSITDEEAREFTFTLDFLEEGKKYRAEIYADGPDAEYDVNPEDYVITSKEVDAGTELTVTLAKGGGQAIRFVAL
ncbi:MAG: glycoside hydrolase family 97 protein [Bacteroidota bacterium]